MVIPNRFVRDAAIRVAGSVGVHVATRTDTDHVRDLIDRLHPVNGGAELIRLGPDRDGGYLIPDDLAGVDYAFSPGVSTKSGFDSALAARGIKVFLADYSVDGPVEDNPLFEFDKKFVGCLTDDTYMTLSDWKSAKIPAHTGDLLLQMDIEGAEYETLLAAPSELIAQFRIMVIEFHFLAELFNRRFYALAWRTFHKLLQSHTVVHIHPNNRGGSIKSGGLEIPRMAEFTFQRNDRLRQRTRRRDFPHPLDRDNNPKFAKLPLPSGWYG
jgi:hypothetical protein